MSGLRWSADQLAAHQAQFKAQRAPVLAEVKREPSDHDSEHDHHAALVKWCAQNVEAIPELKWVYSVPNAARRTVGERGRALSEGLKRGVPDVALPVTTTRFCGLYIEMKRPGNGPTQDQLEWIEHLNSQGYLAVICWSYKHAKETILQYLLRKDEPKLDTPTKRSEALA